ncbi:MAG: prolipoprotein diacylglyceryl transferase [Woeseia sp.]|nr:prolipoprotein diacylglyceryl transferase [Woeseia sp.]|tara:strand:+ start:6461 stop:7243 length:783 start_codon:yes stop_codon:yes gene_type:complete
MFTYPEIDPIIFALGPLKVRWYGLMYIFAFVTAWRLANYRCHRNDSPVNSEELNDLLFYGMLGVIFGGRIGYVIFYGWEQLIHDPLYLFKITQGGMSFHGGLVGVMTSMWLYGKRLGHSIWKMTDFIAPIVPLGLGFGRLGNFINGELWGKPTDVAWAFKVNDISMHATQLYEAFLEGLLLFLILWIYSSKPRPYLAVSGMFLFFYGSFRFAVEFYRIPDAHLEYLALGWVTMGQILSAPMIVVGFLFIFMAYRASEIKR